MTIQSVNTEDMNRRISLLNQQIDQQGIDATNYPTLINIFAYYSLLDQLYININYLLSQADRAKLNDYKKEFFKIYHDIQMRNMDETDDYGISPFEGLLMISFLKKINNLEIVGLQKHGYFFSTENNEKIDTTANQDYYDIADYYAELTKK